MIVRETLFLLIRKLISDKVFCELHIKFEGGKISFAKINEGCRTDEEILSYIEK